MGLRFTQSSPESVLKDATSAVVLSSYNDHVNVLLYNNSEKNKGEASLLKLSTVAPHRNVLNVTQQFTTVQELLEAVVVSNDNSSSSKETIQSFLSNYSFQLTSESGAEYSYYKVCNNGWWGKLANVLRFATTTNEVYTMELISPASDRQIARSLPGESRLVQETPQLYKTIVQPFIEEIQQSGSLSWIENVINGTKEKERLLLDEERFILNIDTKWRSHPDPLTTSRDLWHGHPSAQDLYCLAIVKDSSIATLRDLRQKHVPMLSAIHTLGLAKIEEIYGVDQVRVFCHYQPQFYQFHVHFTRLENQIGCQVERGHLITDIIQNLQMADDFYANRCITYTLSTGSELYRLIQEARRGGR